MSLHECECISSAALRVRECLSPASLHECKCVSSVSLSASVCAYCTVLVLDMPVSACVHVFDTVCMSLTLCI